MIKTYLLLLLLVLGGIILPFVFLKDVYPFHRFGMFAEPVKYQRQQEQFYVLYKKTNQKNEEDFIKLQPEDIPLNANAFEMQLRKHHYQKKHADFIRVFEGIIKKKINLTNEQSLNWKWYHVIYNKSSQNNLDSLCVFSK